MASTSEIIQDMFLKEFPWGLMIEVLENFTFRQLVNLEEDADPVALPKMLGFLLKRNGVIRGEDLMLLNKKNPNMFTNAKFLRCIPDTVNIEVPMGIDEDEWENVLRKVVLNFRSKIKVVSNFFTSIGTLRNMMATGDPEAASLTVFDKCPRTGLPAYVRHVGK